MPLVAVSRELSRALEQLRFAPPVSHVYDPLDYAREPHERYLRRYGGGPKRAVLFGMNPGPYGMAQTGVPFGDVVLVRDWLDIQGRVGRPTPEHPKRPISGFQCQRREISGSRLWGWAQESFGSPEVFFETYFVANYCPLVFMEATGRNRTPDKLAPVERAPLFEHCDQALREVVRLLNPEFVIGVGAFAAKRAELALSGGGPKVFSVLHPSPASPLANRGWAEAVSKQLRAHGLPAP